MSTLRQDLPLLHTRLAERDCVAPVFRTVISWGSLKPDNVSYKQYIKDKHGDTFDEKRNFNQNDLSKLEKNDCSNFDVTILYPLIHLVCEDIAIKGSNDLKIKLRDPNSLESLLLEAKDFRNRIIHEYNTEANSHEVMEVSKTLEAIYQDVARIYKKDKNTLDSAINELRKVFVRIGNECFDRKWVVDYIKQKICNEGMAELKTQWQKHNAEMSIPLLSGKTFNRNNVYSSLRMTVPDVENSSMKRDCSVQQLIENYTTKFRLINGSPGSGKTTMMKCLMDKFLCDGNIMKNEIVIEIACRTSNQHTIVGLLKEKFPRTLSFLEDKYVADVAPQLSITFLFDGFDEVNENSKNLCFHLIHKSRNCSKWTFIISSRPQACEELQDELIRRDVTSITTASIEPISSVDEQQNFLAKFIIANPISGITARDLSKLPAEVSNVLNTPSLLCIFYALLSRKDVNFSTFRNEGSLFAVLLQEIMNDMEKKIIASCPTDNNPASTAAEVQKFVMELSLKLLSSEKYFLTNDVYEKFIRRLTREISQEINFGSVLSCILTPENDSYNFWHNSLLEYLSAKWIVHHIQDWCPLGSASNSYQILGYWQPLRTTANPFFDIIEKTTGSRSLKMLKRFHNMFKYVVIVLEDEQLQAKYLVHVCQVLNTIGANFDYCSQLIAVSADKKAMAKALATLVRDQVQDTNYYLPTGVQHVNTYKCWIISSHDEMVTASLFLVQKKQPLVLDVHWSNNSRQVSTEQLESFLLTVSKEYEGKLSLYLCRMKPNDHFISKLEGARCRLRYFFGRLSQPSTVLSVCRRASGGTLRFYFDNVECVQALKDLQGCASEMTMTLPWNLALPGPSPMPLMQYGYTSNPGINIQNDPAASGKQVADLIKKCVPKSNWYGSIRLANCHFSDETLDQIIEDMESSGIHTEVPQLKPGFMEFKKNKHGVCEGCRCRHTLDTERCGHLYNPSQMGMMKKSSWEFTKRLIRRIKDSELLS